MNDFTDMLSKAKEMKKKMEQVQESLKNIEVEGVSGGNLVKIILKGDYEMKSIVMDKNVEKEKKEIINDLIIAAYNDAKDKLKKKTSEELAKATGLPNLPLDIKLPF
ncbi:MAG: 30S ribosomal protein S21 [Candidatus Marinimicrobia bacterium]|nr:30S ribosomal protein S21 [Candidatus Neomarinimicrobiota bacterium]|tara:strand:- start:1343 stop:1663 length:321 start_codon:yes stop_codon:yes gene_type:complete